MSSHLPSQIEFLHSATNSAYYGQIGSKPISITSNAICGLYIKFSECGLCVVNKSATKYNWQISDGKLFTRMTSKNNQHS